MAKTKLTKKDAPILAKKRLKHGYTLVNRKKSSTTKKK